MSFVSSPPQGHALEAGRSRPEALVASAAYLGSINHSDLYGRNKNTPPFFSFQSPDPGRSPKATKQGKFHAPSACHISLCSLGPALAHFGL